MALVAEKELVFSDNEFECVALYTRSSIGTNKLTNETIVSNKTIGKFLPILKDIGVIGMPSMTFEDPEGRERSVPLYNRDVASRMSRDSIRVKMLNSRGNDVLLGDYKIILNFTSKILTVRDKRGLLKTYSPLDGDCLGILNECILIVSTESHNRTMYVNRTGGVIDESDTYVGDREYVSVSDLLTMIDESGVATMKPNYKKFARQVQDFAGNVGEDENSIMSVSLMEFDGDDIQILKQGHDIFIPELEYVISTNSPLKTRNNPLTGLANLTRSVYEGFSNKLSLSMFIVDNQGHIGDRWASLVDEAVVIPSTKSELLDEGLYILKTTEAIASTTKPIHTLDEIEAGLPYLFKTREEAKAGLNTGDSFKLKYEELSNKLKNEELEAKRELARANKELSETQMEVSNLKSLNDKHKTLLESDIYKEKAALEKQVNDSEQQLVLLKHSLDKAKSERVDTSEVEKLARERESAIWKDKLDREKASRDEAVARAKSEMDSNVNFYKTLTAVVGFAGLITATVIKLTN